MRCFSHILSLIYILAFLLVYTSSQGCETVEKPLSKVMVTGKTFITKSPLKKISECTGENCNAGCCDKGAHKHGSKDCNGSCNSSGCAMGHSFSGFANLNNLLGFNSLVIAYRKKSSFYYQNPIYSFGFHNIWQPPKIGYFLF